MAYLLSSNTPKTIIPDSYVQPPEKRPGPTRKCNVPIVDLSDEKGSLKDIVNASKDLGLFQVVNHGVPLELMNMAIKVFEEVFKLPQEEKAKIKRGDDTNKVCRLYSSTFQFDKEKYHNWRDVLRTTCNSLEECLKFWPQNPQRFKDIVGAFVIALKELGSRILACISKGLGLDQDYLGTQQSKDSTLIVNHYPPCPDPNLTLGIPKHTDPSLITIIQSCHVPGLQVIKNGEWFSVETPPNSFIVFMGNQMVVVSNGELKAVEHRVVNATEARTSIVFNLIPSEDCTVGPAKALLSEEKREVYKTFTYKEFFAAYSGPKPEGVDHEDVVQTLKIRT
ncbi:flavanone 3-dioxygenase 2-like [Silene latifolia]|uniref:flavanone 3-dioxygenase 2-like n=1 Tax=Silene latifolia TaxID=37657 RepID=UPI003D787E7B